MANSSAYLDPKTLATIGSLEMRARLIVEGLMTGMHTSPYQGVSVEFAQHRQYAPGDDIRHLDWKVFGRTDKLYLKQYQKETNLDLFVLVDVSGSMSYASEGQKGWRKFDHAASLAAAMTYLSLRQQDRVGLCLFSSRMLQATRLSNTHEHWRSVVDLLQHATPSASESNQAAQVADSGASPVVPAAATPALSADAADTVTDLARVFDQVIAKLRQRSLIVLVSDLFTTTATFERALARLHHRRHDLIVLQTLDPAELTFPFRSPSDFIGLESEGRLALDPAALRDQYLEALKAHTDTIVQTTRRFGFDHLMLDASESLAAPLGHFLARRSASITRGA